MNASARTNASARREILVAAALAVATVALYWPTLDHGFVRYDDPRYVTDNPHVADGLSADVVVWAFSEAHRSNWHPLTWLSHALDVTLFGLEPAGHHLVNVLLHALNAVLLLAVLVRATGALGPSAFAAALFALHPLHVESVAWIAERKDVLSTAFGLLSLHAYVGYARCGGRGRLLASAAWLLAGLLAKPMLVTWPFLFLLLDYWPLGRLRRTSVSHAPQAAPARPLLSLVREKAVHFVLVGGVAVGAFLAQRAGGAMAASADVALVDRLQNAFLAYASYVGMVIVPVDLAVHYPHRWIATTGSVPPPAWLVFAATLGVLAVTWAACQPRVPGYVTVGWLWFVGTLVPTIGLVQVGTQGLADRYTYWPAVGLFVVAAWGARDLAARLPRPVPPRALAATGTAVVLVYAAMSSAHLPVWRDSTSLFEQAVRVTPTDIPMRRNLAAEYAAAGRPDDARAQYEEILRIAARRGIPLEALAPRVAPAE